VLNTRHTQSHLSLDDMGIVPTGLVRKLYEDASQITESAPYFWKVWLDKSFHEMDIYAVIYEHDPEASLDSVDVVVVQYDAVHHTLTPVLFTHSKWASEDIGQNEEQVAKAALTYMARGNLQRIHARTTVGLSFQVWVVNREKEELVLSVLHSLKTLMRWQKME
jgi:hypothetical protein